MTGDEHSLADSVFIKNLVLEVGSVNGSISEHLSVLKHTVMKVDKLIYLEDAQFERSIILELIEAVDSIEASSLIKNVPATYFAENLHAMLSDFETEVEDEETDEMFLNLVTLENVTHFNYCFFPLFEANKYPRKFFETFPFNREIIEILGNPKYGINRVPSEYKDMSAHITLEENLFRNVLDFTCKQLVFTMTQKEDEHKNYISHYAHDIASIFDSEIIFTEQHNESGHEAALFTGSKPPALHLPDKEQYTLKELVTYKLCPRLYYHGEAAAMAFSSKFQLQFYFVAVLFSAALNEFKAHNLENKKTYRIGNNEALETIKPLFEAVYNKYIHLFNIFTNYELSDIRATVQRKIQNFFSDLNEKGIKGNVFTVVGVPENPVHVGNGYDLVLEYDTKIYDMENRFSRISQNDIFTDFLVLKTLDDSREPLKHYADMLDALERNQWNCDRVNLVFKMIGKINIQFESKRYAHDGIVRTDALVDEIRHTDFSYLKPYASKFCQYCRINDICKERAVLR